MTRMNKKMKQSDSFTIRNPMSEERISIICEEMVQYKILEAVKHNGLSSFAMTDRFLMTLSVEITNVNDSSKAMQIIIQSIMKNIIPSLFTKEQIRDYYEVIEAMMLANQNCTPEEYIEQAMEFAREVMK